MNHPLRQNARLTSFLRKALKPCFAVCALAPVFGVHSASAQLTWEGNDNLGGNGSWNLTPGNTVWSNNGLPPGTTAWTNPNTATFSGPDGSVTVTITGSSTVINATAITFASSGYTIKDDGSGASLQLDNGTTATSATITVNSGQTATITTALTSGFNADTLKINGGGTLTINGFNDATYFGATITIDGGTTVKTAVNVAQGTGNFAIPQASAIVIGDGTGAGTLDLNGTSQTLFSLAGGTNGTVENLNGAAYSNLTAGTSSNGGGSTNFQGTIKDTGTTVETTNTLTPNGDLGLTVNAPAAGYTLILSGSNTYHGVTIVGNGTNPATLEAGATNAFSANSVVNVNAGSTVNLGGYSQMIAALNGTGTGTVTNTTTAINAVATPATLTLDGDGTSDTLSSSAILADGPSTSTLALIKNGAYTQVLTGSNTYSGGTTVNGGVLLVSNTSGSGTGSGTVLVANGGTLGGGGTVAGAITLNSGGTIQPGAGTGTAGTTLHGSSMTWNGGGVLDLTLGSGTGDQLTLTGALTKGTAGSFDVNITNDGIAQKDYTLATFVSTTFTVGNFTLVLPAGYTGVLEETATSLDLVLSVPTSGPVIQNSAPVGTPTDADFTVIGPVVTGTPTQSNTINSLTFTPGSSLEIFQTLYVTQGPVNLVGGSSLKLDGDLSVNQLNVLFEGFLNGTGMILGNLYNAGTVSPGDAPGQIHVSGNYTQTPTGLLQIKIGGQSLPSHDLLSVGGSATLGGTLQLVQLNGFKLQRDEPITFLTAGAGVIGKFANVIDGFPTDTILDPTVVYGSNSVALEAVQGSFEKFADSAGLTPNEKAVAGGLDKIAFRNNPPKVIQFLDDRPLSKLPGDFDKISPEELTSIYTIGVALSQVQSQNIQRRTDDIRSGSSGFSAAGLAINGDGPSFSGGFDITTGVAGPSGDDGKESKEMKEVAPPENRWGAFLSGTGEWVSVGDTNNARGFQLESGGFTLGVDYKLTPHLAVGLAAGYTGTTSDLNSGGRIFVNGGKIGLYGTTFVGGWYADTAVFGGYNSYDTRRTALEGDARSSTDGGEVDVVFGTGYDFKAGGLTFGPTATFNYTYLGLNGFSENGSLAPLNIHGGDADSLRTAVGFKASYDWKMGGVLLKPELRAAWQHEYGDTAYSLDSSFTNGGDGAFTVDGPKLGRDSALLGAGFAIQFNERTSVYFYYDGELGRTNYESNSVTGGVRIAF